MKTPVEKIIYQMKIARKLCDDPSMEMDIFHTLDVLIQKAESIIEEEKTIIVNAVDGWPIHIRHLNGEDYYNEIFNKTEQ